MGITLPAPPEPLRFVQNAERTARQRERERRQTRHMISPRRHVICPKSVRFLGERPPHRRTVFVPPPSCQNVSRRPQTPLRRGRDRTMATCSRCVQSAFGEMRGSTLTLTSSAPPKSSHSPHRIHRRSYHPAPFLPVQAPVISAPPGAISAVPGGLTARFWPPPNDEPPLLCTIEWTQPLRTVEGRLCEAYANLLSGPLRLLGMAVA